MKVVLRTYGGLGNQLFQLVYARLYADHIRFTLCEVHDQNYKHRFTRSKELEKCPDHISPIQQFLSSLRLPKILHRIGWIKYERIAICGDIYLDGYFQSAEQYEHFEPFNIAVQLIRVRHELQISTEKKSETLVHLRLGDFFSSDEAARSYAVQRLREVPPGSTFITNQESLFADPNLQSVLANTGCKLQTTKGFSPEAIIRLMSQFKNIIGNDSTLVFWASILGDCNVKFRSPELIKLNYLFKNCLN